MDLKSRRLDNVWTQIPSDSCKQRTITYVRSMKILRGKVTKLTKVQMIRCARESGYDGMIHEVARAVLEDTRILLQTVLTE